MMQSDTIEEETDIPNAFDFQTIFKQSEQLHEQQIEKLRDQVFHELCTLLRKKSATIDDWQRFKEQDAFYYIASNDDIFIEQLYTFIKNQKISMRSTNVLLQLIDEVSLYDESSRYELLQEELYQRFVYWKQRQDEISIIKAYFGGSILVVVDMLLSLLFHNETFHLISMIVFCFYIGYIQFFSKKRVGNRKLRNPLSPLSIILSMIIVFLTYYYLMRQNIIQ